MKKLVTLKQAVSSMVETYEDLKCNFSVYDITRDIRDAVNEDILQIYGIPYRDVEIEIEHVDDVGQPYETYETIRTQFIDHSKVKSEFYSMFDNNELGNLIVLNTYPYKQFGFTNKPIVNRNPSKPQVMITSPKQRKSSDKLTFVKLENYLNARPDKKATLKQIQSRFKNIKGLTCQDILDTIESEVKQFGLKFYDIKKDNNALSKTEIEIK